MIDLITGIVIGIVVILLLAIVVIFNSFVTKRNRVQTAWAQIDVQLKRRFDLIPNLVNTVKGYKGYEKSVLTQVTALRTSIVSGSVQDKAAANNQLSQALKSIFAVAENYPDLKASDNFKMLQTQLEDTEDKIAFVRTSYNDYVLDYNNALQEFPGNVFAGMFGFAKQDFFQTAEGEKAPIKVDFEETGPDIPGTATPPPQQQSKHGKK